MTEKASPLDRVLDLTEGAFDTLLSNHHPDLKAHEIGVVDFIGYGIARVVGLPGVRSEEMIRFPGNLYGMAFNLDEDNVGVILWATANT
jgi:F-type H+/Na+-transporting ATPase subunit alpha